MQQCLLAASLSLLAAARAISTSVALPAPPPPPAPEPVSVTRLSLPPVTNGTCNNARGTGCIAQHGGVVQAGTFLPDSRHVLATVNFTGSPGSVYDGEQLIVVKTTPETFSNGHSWKCITCGIPAENAVGRARTMDYPQAFADGKRVLAGAQVIDCGGNDLVSDMCLPNATHIYPLRFENSANGTGPGGAIREQRLHPDNVHVGFSSFTFTGGALGQYAYFARLTFNPAPTTGEPLAPRYDLEHVNLLYNANATPPISVEDGNIMKINKDAISVGELRGFSGTGDEISYIGYPAESCNIDVFAVGLANGQVRRLTSHPGYVDPVEFSPDDNWFVIQDTRASGRTDFMDGVRGIPPVTDQLTATACSSVRNNGARRFFQPYLLDRHGDRGEYYGQRLNAEGSGEPGSGDINDPEWNGMADPWFSPDGTQVVYWQALTVPPACGGANPLPCYASKEPGGLTERIMVARLTSRDPLPSHSVKEMADSIPWATPYVPGEAIAPRAGLKDGNYTLKGQSSGSASVRVSNVASTIEVVFHGFSDDGVHILSGSQNITSSQGSVTLNKIDWYADLVRAGPQSNDTQFSSADGFHLAIDVLQNLFGANGTLTSIVDGIEYKQPLNGA